MWDDEPPKAVKLGMLTSAETIRQVATFLALQANGKDGGPTVILDPVMVSTSGHSLIPEDAIDAIKEVLVPAVQWLTPNIPEAQKLLLDNGEVKTLEDMFKLGTRLVDQFGIQQLLLKGGHLSVQRDEVLQAQMQGGIPWQGRTEGKETCPVQIVWEEGDSNGDGIEVFEAYRQSVGIKRQGDLVVDILFQNKGESLTLFVGPKIDTKSTHGTGCTLSAALACASALRRESANGDSKTDESQLCGDAIRYVKAAIGGAFLFGQGNGPLHHGVLSFRRALPP